MNEVLKTLKRERKNIRFFYSFMIISTTVMTFYMNLMFAKPMEKIENYLFLCTLSLGVIAVVILLGFYASQSFLEAQMKQIGIYKLAGVSFNQLISFIAKELIFVLLFAIPLGFLFGLVAVNLFYMLLFHSFVFIFSLVGMLTAIFVLVVEMIYFVLIAMGYIYKNEILTLLGYQKVINAHVIKERVTNFKLPELMPLILFMLGYLLLIRMPVQVYQMLMITLLTQYLFMNGIIKRSLYWLFMGIKKIFITNEILVTALSHAQVILKDIVVFIQLFSVLSTALIISYPLYHFNTVTRILVVLMYLSILACLLFAMTFQVSHAMSANFSELSNLRLLGMRDVSRRRIMKAQLLFVYMIMFFLIFLFPVTIAVRMVQSGLLCGYQAIFSLSISAVFVLSGCLLNLIFASRKVY